MKKILRVATSPERLVKTNACRLIKGSLIDWPDRLSGKHQRSICAPCQQQQT